MKLKEYLTKIGKKEYVRKNYTLDNIKEVLNFLGNPQDKIKNVIHITGTNGKGTVAVYTSKILESLGYNIGLYISPHIFKVNERIQYNNTPIPSTVLYTHLKEVYSKTPNRLFFNLTYFELLTCVMFKYFAELQPDFVVLEVGLGGKLDATNVITYSIVSCITSVGLDHTEVLGRTKFDILKDKSGIIKPNSIFICGEMDKNLVIYLKRLCNRLNTKFVYVDKRNIKNIEIDFQKNTTKCIIKTDGRKLNFSFPSCSVIQPYNFLLAYEIICQLKQHGYIKNISFGRINSVAKTTNIPFRMQKIKYSNLEIVIDGAHNPDAVKNFVRTMQKAKVDNMIVCFTIMKEKDYKTIISVLAKIKNKIEKLIVYRLNTPRSQKLSLMYNTAKIFFGNKVLKFSKISNMLKYIIKFCKKQKVFFIGSFYTGIILKKLESYAKKSV